MQDEPRLSWRVDAFADATGMPRSAVYDAIKRGDLRTFKVGRGRYVSCEAGREFIKAREREAAA